MTQLRNIQLGGLADTNNSTSTPLGIGADFLETVTDAINYGWIVVSVYTDQASATDGLTIEFSSDGIMLYGVGLPTFRYKSFKEEYREWKEVEWKTIKI